MLVDPPHNMQRDRNADKSEYDVFTLEDMRYIAKMLGDLIKPGSHCHVFRSSVQFSL